MPPIKKRPIVYLLIRPMPLIRPTKTQSLVRLTVKALLNRYSEAAQAARRGASVVMKLLLKPINGNEKNNTVDHIADFLPNQKLAVCHTNTDANR